MAEGLAEGARRFRAWRKANRGAAIPQSDPTVDYQLFAAWSQADGATPDTLTTWAHHVNDWLTTLGVGGLQLPGGWLHLMPRAPHPPHLDGASTMERALTLTVWRTEADPELAAGDRIDDLYPVPDIRGWVLGDPDSGGALIPTAARPDWPDTARALRDWIGELADRDIIDGPLWRAPDGRPLDIGEIAAIVAPRIVEPLTARLDEHEL